MPPKQVIWVEYENLLSNTHKNSGFMGRTIHFFIYCPKPMKSLIYDAYISNLLGSNVTFYKQYPIDDDNALETAISEFPKLSSLPGFDEIMEGYPIDKYIYVVQFMPTGYEHETITCEGIVVDKEDMTIRIKAHRNRKK